MTLSLVTGFMPTELMSGQSQIMVMETAIVTWFVEGRDEPGRTTSGPDTTTRGKTRRHSGSNSLTKGRAISEQKPIQHKASTTTTED